MHEEILGRKLKLKICIIKRINGVVQRNHARVMCVPVPRPCLCVSRSAPYWPARQSLLVVGFAR